MREEDINEEEEIGKPTKRIRSVISFPSYYRTKNRIDYPFLFQIVLRYLGECLEGLKKQDDPARVYASLKSASSLIRSSSQILLGFFPPSSIPDDFPTTSPTPMQRRLELRLAEFYSTWETILPLSTFLPFENRLWFHFAPVYLIKFLSKSNIFFSLLLPSFNAILSFLGFYASNSMRETTTCPREWTFWKRCVFLPKSFLPLIKQNLKRMNSTKMRTRSNIYQKEDLLQLKEIFSL